MLRWISYEFINLVMAGIKVTKKRVLILYYSFSSQTRNLLQAFADGLEDQGIEICWQQLKPLKKLQFPLGSVSATLAMMLKTFFRKRVEIEPIGRECFSHWDLVVLAGPTWSYNPSGPILSLLDNDAGLFDGKKVLPFISCRGYWRVHYWSLRHILKKKGAQVVNPLVFRHIGKEPWLTIGVFLKLVGKTPESGKSWFKKYYTKYGHSRGQVAQAKRVGTLFGEKLESNNGCEEIDIAPVKDVFG